MTKGEQMAQEAEELADEAEAEEAEGEEVEEDEEPEEVDLNSMDRSALKAYIKERGLDIKVKKSWTDDDIREQINKALAPEVEAPKAEEKKAEKKAAKKAAAESGEKKIGKRGLKLDPKNNEDDRKEFDCLHQLFPEDEYAYAWVASAGVTIKHMGKNSQRAMVLIENCSKQADNSVKCNLYLLTFTKQTAVLDEAGIEYEICWSGAPFLKGITMTEAVEIITGLMPHITATVQKIDKRLGENRAKMEESLNKKVAKKTVKK